ncbi:paramyosin-like [Huso huso]|uniref:Paramyosin-like n=1 Tax=Huso huso TaxID=61971 RepID=A0ABR0YRV5_HUSHU
MSHSGWGCEVSWPPRYHSNHKRSPSYEMDRMSLVWRGSEPPRSKPTLRVSRPSLERSYEDAYGGRRPPVKAQMRAELLEPCYTPSSLSGYSSRSASPVREERARPGTPIGGLYSEERVSSSLSNGVPVIRRWHSLSRLAPEGAPHRPGDLELRSALGESGDRRAELVKQLREAHSQLEDQAEHLRFRDSQLEASKARTELLALKHKQLETALSALEQEKEVLELTRFEETRRRGDLQDKVLQLELDMLKVRSTLERGSAGSSLTGPPTHSALTTTISRTQDHIRSAGSSLSDPLTHSALTTTFSRTQDHILKQGRERAEREAQEARQALRRSQDRAEALEAERDRALQQIQACQQGQLTVLSQTNETNQRLTTSIRAQSNLHEELNDLRTEFSQVSLEKELLSSKVVRLEENVADLKMKLTGAVADKDRFLQEKAELHQHVQVLQLELERAQRGREGFTDQVCDLHVQLVGAKTQVNRQDQEKILTTEELCLVKQVNVRMSTELAEAKQRLEAALKQLHQLGAEKVIYTNQISALETERCQLIGEKEVLMSVEGGGAEEELQELRDSQDRLQTVNQQLLVRCQGLEAGLCVKEAELQQKEEELCRKEAELLSQGEEQQQVAQHWKERWQEAAVALRSKDEELEEAHSKLQSPADTSQHREEARQLASDVERLQSVVHRNQEKIQRLLREKAEAESELRRAKQESSSLLRVELDACKQQLELERSRSQALQHRLPASPATTSQHRHCVHNRVSSCLTCAFCFSEIDGAADSKQEDRAPPPEELLAQISALHQQLEEGSSAQQRQQSIIQSLREELEELKLKKPGDIKASLEEVDSDLFQVREELQKVWDMLKTRDSELEEQHLELESARGQVSECSGEKRRLEQALASVEQDLVQK